MLFLMWLEVCALVALSSAAVARADGPWLLGVAAIVAAQAALLAGATRLRPWVAWTAALACVGVGAVGQQGTDLALYLGLVAAMLIVADRFATLLVALSAFCLPDGAGPRALGAAGLLDPVAREFARARREGSRIAVASIAVPQSRGASRRLARIIRRLVTSLRPTDAVVRVIPKRAVVMLPGGDDDVARAVVARAMTDDSGEVLVGTATFPKDGPTWDSLKEAARSRERPWPPTARQSAERLAARVTRDGAPDKAAPSRASGRRS